MTALDTEKLAGHVCWDSPWRGRARPRLATWRRCGGACSRGCGVWRIWRRAWTPPSVVSSGPAAVEDLHTTEVGGGGQKADEDTASRQPPRHVMIEHCVVLRCTFSKDVLSSCDVTPPLAPSFLPQAARPRHTSCSWPARSGWPRYWCRTGSPCIPRVLWTCGGAGGGRPFVSAQHGNKPPTRKPQVMRRERTCCLKRLHQTAVWWQSGTRRPPSHEASWASWYLWGL